MERPVIIAEHVSKSYRLGLAGEQAGSFREAISNVLSSPFKRLREMREKGTERDTFWALKDVNFEINRGEVVGLIGRNGAGKSTLLKVLSRITEPTSGSVRMRGRVASLLEVGTGFHPDLSGRENVYLNGSILGMKHAEIARKFDEIVAFAEIEQFIDTPVKRYSSGMYVRLAFAVAAHLEPEVLIIDEVLAVGDTAFQEKCLGKVNDLTRGRERTVFFVSHNLKTVRSLCSRAIWFKSGQIIMDAPAGQTVDRYLNESSGALNNDFDVEDAQRYSRDQVSPLRILRVSFNDGQPIRNYEPMTVTIDYRTTESIKAVAFAIPFSSPESGRVMCVDSDIPSGHGYDIPANVTGRARFVIPQNLLQPARYTVGVIARLVESTPLDYIPNFAQVEVQAGDQTPPHLVGMDEAGCVRMPAEWSNELVETDMAIAVGAQGDRS